MKEILKDKTLLITGGTGSLGKALTSHILDKYPNIKKLVIYSRDQQKQFQMAQEYPSQKYPQLRFLIGDVRDEHWRFRKKELWQLRSMFIEIEKRNIN